jgi:hypothetical protein
MCERCDMLERALWLAIGDLLESEGKPRTGPGADSYYESLIARAAKQETDSPRPKGCTYPDCYCDHENGCRA